LLSKPSAVVVPFIIAALDFFIFKPKEKKWIFPAVWLLLALPVMIITKLSQPDAEVEFVAPLWSRVFIVGDTISFYLYKLFWPFGLSASYGRTPEAVLDSLFIYFLWIIPAGLLYLMWKIKDNLPFFSLGILIFLISILPVSGILSFEFQKFSTVADRYMYLPMMGVALVLASLINKYKNKYSYLFSGIVAFVYLIINVNQQEIWKDDLILWRTTAQQNPGQPHVHSNYGISLHDVGRYDEAIQQYNLALQARPEFASAYNNRGNSHAFKRDFQSALADQTRAIELDPGFGRAWFNRAVTHFQLGRLQEAMHDLEQAEKSGYRAHPQFRRDLEKEMQRRK
jgi:protein O-mannosyl-transferase